MTDHVQEVFIEGVPYCRSKNRGDILAPARWTEHVKQASKGLTPVTGPCEVTVEFILPADKFPRDFPHGPDLDNLLKRLLDAVQDGKAIENDSLIVSITASKRRVCDGERTGVRLLVKRRGGTA